MSDIEAQVCFECGRIPVRRQTPFARVPGFDGVTTLGEAQSARQELSIRAVEREIDRAQISATFRIAERIPLQTILAGKRHGVGQLRLRRKIIEWPKQYIGIAPRCRKDLL